MQTDTVAVILAGGQARRMGGIDKARLVVGGRSILDRTRACLAPQVAALAISAFEPGRFAGLGLPVLPDPVPGQPGPLAGILAGLDWAEGQAPWLLTVPADCPFLPPDLVSRLHEARPSHRVLGQPGATATFACAASAGRDHPVVALWPTACRDELRAALGAGMRRVAAFTAGRIAVATWATQPWNPFLNVNTPQDLVAANAISSANAASAPSTD